ncbi:hypothetical protein L598_000700000890 [Mesorhizobium sp. J18]|uniref:hypothetical protein n=1 Tax=Mesorhizobium sp. J18 TaxID=935263 RepID=UPI00119BC1EE|nr:hypothetical protein [Mesorhizobium sp. J18]TWG90332.1 hypothetical protein L598_000700000890 [Mesorhizobium sp. J18]
MNVSMDLNAQQMLAKQKAMLAEVTPSELMQRVRDFRRSEHRTLNDEQLTQEILKVMSVNSSDGSQRAFLKIHVTEFPTGTLFFRARRAEDSSIPPQTGTTIRDSEAPDGSLVRRPGRLHKIGESVLYTAIHDPHITLSECRIPVGSHAVIFAYKARRSIKAPIIGATEHGSEFTDEEKLKLNIINDFLHDEFAREVEVGLEHLYRSSEIIAKWWFDGPPELQDCWVYSSTKNRQSLNAAFRPMKAHECLDLVGSILVRRIGENQMQCLSVGKPNKKKFQYFPIGSPEQKVLFPQIGA